MTDAKNRTNTVTMETTPVTCGRCGRTFANSVIEEVEGFDQLRVGDFLITNIEANCSRCGFKYRWKIDEKNVEKMILSYEKLISLYSPE